MRILSVDPGRKNFAAAVVDVRDPSACLENVIVAWHCLELPESPPELVTMLNTLFSDVATYDVVVIERQPPKNMRMQRLQHHLEMYFVIRGVPVEFIDARRKLMYAETTEWWRGTTGAKNIKSYVRRKKLAVGVVQRYLEMRPDQYQEALAVFRRAKKQDDYADCLLQALAFAHYEHVEEPQGPKKIKCLPAPKPPKPGVSRLIKSNVVFLLKDCVSEDDMHAVLRDNQLLGRAFSKFFKTTASYVERLEKTAERTVRLEKKRQTKITNKLHTAVIGALTAVHDDAAPENDPPSSPSPPLSTIVHRNELL